MIVDIRASRAGRIAGGAGGEEGGISRRVDNVGFISRVRVAVEFRSLRPRRGRQTKPDENSSRIGRNTYVGTDTNDFQR